MAQLNPNFEIDFNDINSYEQVQLINDTQLAKENLLMHKAYKEPAEDEIIRNQFSSFTFVDFCPKLFNSTQKSVPTNDRSSSNPSRHQQYSLETFSDLFDRINMWLRVNRDWRVVSMETLIFDCASQFNHLKSSFHSSTLPRNMRGLRLYLSPTKSRFSGPQKIGCINVIPRRISEGQLAADSNEVNEYETLDQILARLNELLLTRPIEGRILSVETITLPIVNGYVNTETNYFMDNRLNALSQRIYNHANDGANRAKLTSKAAETMQQVATPPAVDTQLGGQPPAEQEIEDMASTNRIQQPNGLIDTLRVYYEFGPRVCGLVNMIDFLPRFNLRQTLLGSAVASPTPDRDLDGPKEFKEEDSLSESSAAADDELRSTLTLTAPRAEQLDIDSTESLTRLIGRSLNWFEAERKRVMCEGINVDNEDSSESSSSSDLELNATNSAGSQTVAPKNRQVVDLKVCNLQVHTKVLLKACLSKVTPQNAREVVQSGQMFHGPPKEPIVCHPCGLSSSTHELQEWCSHLVDLNQPFELKFVRLAYVVPVCGEYITCLTRSLRSLPSRSSRETPTCSEQAENQGKDVLKSANGEICMANSPPDGEDDDEQDGEEEEDDEEDENDEDDLGEILAAVHENAEKLAKEASLEIVNRTNERHKRYEELHQLQGDPETVTDFTSASPEPGQLIGQLTYRLFAPCQLVNSSSCFSINPVNSSNPLARRGSVVSDNGSCSDNFTPSTLLLPASNCAGESPSGSTLTINTSHEQQQPFSPTPQVISFGAFFPALTHDSLLGSHNNQKSPGSHSHAKNSNSHRFATNEFESVDAIKRRMEVYVTTNSMKVLAGETLVVNLSDHLSCLSNAIEQTIIKASFSAARQPSTWVSVYILYAAVDEPHLPSQLLEQQKLRERLELISEVDEDEQEALESVEAAKSQRQQAADELTGQNNMVPVFDDDFKCEQKSGKDQESDEATKGRQQRATAQSTPSIELSNTLAALNLENGSIRVELSHQTELPPYNSAYDRTVALPTQPDDHLANYLEPVDLNLAGSWSHAQEQQPSGGNVWLDDNDLIEVRSYRLSNSNVRDASKLLRMRQQQQSMQANLTSDEKRKTRAKKGVKRKSKTQRTGEHSQCSVM